MSISNVHHLKTVEASPALYTVEDVQTSVRELMNKGGVICPCCDQLVKVYQRSFTGVMARALIWLYWYQHLNQCQWVHVNTEGPAWITQSGGSFATMRHWGFIQERPPQSDDTDAKRCQGYWTITAYGKSIVHLIRFPKYVYSFNMEKVGESRDVLTDIRTALGTRFNYQEMMEAHANV